MRPPPLEATVGRGSLERNKDGVREVMERLEKKRWKEAYPYTFERRLDEEERNERVKKGGRATVRRKRWRGRRRWWRERESGGVQRRCVKWYGERNWSLSYSVGKWASDKSKDDSCKVICIIRQKRESENGERVYGDWGGGVVRRKREWWLDEDKRLWREREWWIC